MPTQFQPQPGRAVETVGTETQGAGGLDVAFEVVDVQGARRVQIAAPDRELEDARVRLGELDLARHYDVLEPVEEREALASDGKGLRRPVGEREQAVATLSQCREQLDALGNLAAQHLRPARVPQGSVV